MGVQEGEEANFLHILQSLHKDKGMQDLNLSPICASVNILVNVAVKVFYNCPENINAIYSWALSMA